MADHDYLSESYLESVRAVEERREAEAARIERERERYRELAAPKETNEQRATRELDELWKIFE